MFLQLLRCKITKILPSRHPDNEQTSYSAFILYETAIQIIGCEVPLLVLTLLFIVICIYDLSDFDTLWTVVDNVPV
jgi:hypothetical protein